MPNRYDEFWWATCQWRNLKLRKWFGFGHHNENPAKGLLALFCTACPQPGINLPADFKTHYTEYIMDWHSLWYFQWISLRTETMWSFVVDCNFTVNHIKQWWPQADVWLSDGEGMMTATELYTTHIRLARDTKDVHCIYYWFKLYWCKV